MDMFEVPGDRLRELSEAAEVAAHLTPGSLAVVLERYRQIHDEGWDDVHDDEKVSGSLAVAAMCYSTAAVLQITRSPSESLFIGLVPEEWPWDERWWKPSSDPVRNLVKAGALLAAEIDRIKRSRDDDGV